MSKLAKVTIKREQHGDGDDVAHHRQAEYQMRCHHVAPSIDAAS